MNVAMYNANEAQNWDELAYLAGRFTRICLIVEPLPIETFEDPILKQSNSIIKDGDRSW